MWHQWVILFANYLFPSSPEEEKNLILVHIYNDHESENNYYHYFCDLGPGQNLCDNTHNVSPAQYTEEEEEEEQYNCQLLIVVALTISKESFIINSTNGQLHK